MQPIFETDPPIFQEFFKGKDLLNNQSFRDLFRVQELPTDLKLKVSNITILFSDLKGSTELYDKTGDMHAYGLVQEHFDVLKTSTRMHSGAIIKTIGDAIMASFSKPIDGILAATDMMEGMERLSRKRKLKKEDVAIKVGLHTGNALAVNANEALDYFGHTVNIAARVQGLAKGGEIWVTDSVYKSEGVEQILTANDCQAFRQSALLKGVSLPTTVYQCTL